MPSLQRPLVVALALVALTSLVDAQYRDYDRTTPVPILKQINRHNEDGSYSYGYEAADGSFKIETKHPTGEVFGKYGYVDDSGQVREVEYGASKRGFEPAGNDINVAPPTLTNNVAPYQGPDGHDDGQYREDPSVYYKDERYNRPRQRISQPAPQYSSYQAPQGPQPRYSPPAPQQSYYNPPAPQQSYYNAPAPQQNNYNPPAPQQNYYNPPSQPNYYRPPIHVDHNLFRGHPARNFDVNTGSYSVSYTGKK